MTSEDKLKLFLKTRREFRERRAALDRKLRSETEDYRKYVMDWLKELRIKERDGYSSLDTLENILEDILEREVLEKYSLT
jgi:hypothetical protein